MTIQLKRVADQVIVITGATSGIGLLTARTAARRGAKVVLVARNEEALRTIVAEIEAAGGRATYAVADVADRAAVRAAADTAIATFGRIDTWVNCAGVAIYARLEETPDDEHQRLFQTNYFGVVHGALTALEHLRRTGGAIMTIGSIAGDIPSPIMSAYSASKHAVKGFIESVRIEVNADRLPVAITLIKPSGINTPIAEHAANHLDGEALIPPPAYDPQLVADAIIDAAQHSRRDVTVGGIGRLEVLMGTHFPGLLARFGGLLVPFLSDPDRRRTPTTNLTQPVGDGHERSAQDTGRAISAYAIVRRHRIVAGAGVAAVIILARLIRPPKARR